MQIVGRLTNIPAPFTPAATIDNPSPRTFRSIEIEGCRLSLPDGFTQQIPTIGTEIIVDAIAKSGQRGLTLSVVNSPNAIAPKLPAASR